MFERAAWPIAADAAAGERLCAAFGAGAPAGLLRCLGGNSPFLAELALREPAVLRRTIRLGPEAVVARAIAGLVKIPPGAARARVASGLRQAKREVALATAVADIAGGWGLERVTRALSELAGAALRLAVAHLLRSAHDRGELRLPDPADPPRGSGFTVLGMGKLGAGELNYSSDVDLILLHDPEAGVVLREGVGGFYTRIARGLVQLMEARDSDGYVFRTDLRLRPDPAATPPSMSMVAAITYYESMGQSWERAAMLKARPVAGDLGLGAVFLDAIRPFVWRRQRDFWAVADIAAVKRRIDAHKGGGSRGLLGFDVKLGQGGIREIEFLCQTLQLVWGGREPGLRTPRTLRGLRVLAQAGHLSPAVATTLAGAYRYLRRVEHRLQMVADRQTHALPGTAAQFDGFARFMGEQSGKSLGERLEKRLGQVRLAYDGLFEGMGETGDPEGFFAICGEAGASEAQLGALKRMGYDNSASIVLAICEWQAGRPRAMRSPRARELMQALLPRLLAALARQAQPDLAFARWDAVLGRLPAGVQLLSLFQRNPALLDRVAAVLGAAPSLADYLTRTPSALEGLLAPEMVPDFARLLRGRLGDARGLEEAIGVIRTAVREEGFAIAVATMEGRMDADAAGFARSDLADAALEMLFERVLADFAERFGTVRGGGMVLIVLGKAGSREMMAGSDLDLMLVYDHPASVTQSAGAKVLPASQWFIRAVHAYVAALTAPDAEGAMFDVDMRLRPSGSKGPVAVSLAGFARYHAAEAWTWERMALTRARVVAGPPALRRRVEAAIRAALGGADPARVRPDAAAMRRRMARELPPEGVWDVKLRAGGQVEVEFIAQALQLLHPQAASPTTRLALGLLRDAGVLAEGDAAVLIRADHLWRTVQGMLRIVYGRRPVTALSDAPGAALLRVCGAAGAEAVDLEGLRVMLDQTAAQVRALFESYLEPLPT